MKILAFNGSPKSDKGNTALILAPFLAGLEDGGAEVELFYTKKLKINPCSGEGNCWVNHPGRCWQDDDMNNLLPKIREADILVFACPVYCDGVTAPIKNLIDRFLPIPATCYTMRDGHMRLGVTDKCTHKKVVLVSTCGLWEIDNFDPLLVHMKAFCRNLAFEFAGALLRPHANMLQAMIETAAPIDDIFDSARRAGRQLAIGGSMNAETLQNISREFIPRDQYIKDLNVWVTGEQSKIKAR